MSLYYDNHEMKEFKKMNMRSFDIYLIILVIILVGPVQKVSAQEQLDFKACQVKQGAVIMDAQCAVLKRALNSEQNNGETIDLFVAKFPALNPSPAKDAFTVIQGGPGGSSIDLFIGSHRLFRKIRANRDVIVIDQRGTGRSNILKCSFDENEDMFQEFDPDVVKSLAKKCVDDLDTDLRFYTTSIAVQDLDAMREAAGYDQLSIYGVSYGTRVAQHYLRRFPERTRAVILDGVVDIGLNLAGGEIARRSQAAFDGMSKRCIGSKWCSEKFGDLKSKFEQLRDRLSKKGVEVTFPHPVNGDQVTEIITEGDLLVAVRLMPYSTEQLALLPMLISKAHAGEYTQLAAFSTMLSEGFLDSYAIGMNNSVMCAEDAPYVEKNSLENLQGTYFGDGMAKSIQATCDVWPRGPVDGDFMETFESEKPVLILSGETDPITPPENGARAHQMLSNSKHIIVPAHGHGVIGRGCVLQIATEFVKRGDFEKFNSSCVERERATPFFSNNSGPKL